MSAQFVTDETGGVTVMRDGFAQSYVDLADPGYLAFEYVAQMALALDALAPPAPQPLRVTHIGGAGLTLPRYLAHTRPSSPQIVLEPDAATTDQVRAQLPLPRGHRIRVRAQDGVAGMAALADGSADAVLLDAYADGRVPAALTTVEFLGELARVLAPGGFAILNLADEPGLSYVARVAAGAAAAGLPHVSLLGVHEVLKGKRFGNVVLVASAAPHDADELRRHAARCPHPTGVRGADDVTRLVKGARPFTAIDRRHSPEPPAVLSWRRV